MSRLADRPFPRFAILCALAACVVVLGCNGGTSGPPPGPAPDPEPPPAPEPQAQCAATRSLPETGTTFDGQPDLTRGLAMPKIVGGEDAPIDKFPWAAAIAAERLDGSFFQFCGGSLIAEDWVLTAAHCQVGGGDKVILGREDLRTGEGVVHDVEFALTHADYNPDTQENDIALVKLTTASEQTAVGLVDAADTAAQPGDGATIVGWGRLAEGGATSNVLQEVTVPIITNETCQEAYAADGITLTATMLCAGREEGGQDSCQGDSGGPLMVSAAPGDFRQAGVVSFGIGCARPEKYGVYTRLSQFRDWVEACQANPPAD